ncbi:MAG: ATP phosphoribosyltransferase regulatory subunit [Spirochaetaceae bacterium]
MKKRYLQVPQGTEGVHLEEAYRHRKITEEVFNLFTLWGYLPVETPVFDFYDIYRPLLKGSNRDIYRLVDREGDLLLLRSDITLFLAKQMGLWLREEDLPTRVCYGDTILRHQNAEDISKNEFFQMGAELIGKAGSQADMEVLLLMQSVFSRLGVTPALHIGSQRFIINTLGDLPPEDYSAAVSFLRNRDFEGFTTVLGAHFPPRRTDLLVSICGFLGKREEFSPFISSFEGMLHNEEMEDLLYIEEIVRTLEAAGYGENVRIDLSEIGGQPYYTGIVFRSYLPGLDSALASGGRYDKLLSTFGFDCPSVGFSFMLRKIEHLAENRFSLPGNIEKVDEGDFIETFKKAEKLRSEGRIALL